MNGYVKKQDVIDLIDKDMSKMIKQFKDKDVDADTVVEVCYSWLKELVENMIEEVSEEESSSEECSSDSSVTVQEFIEEVSEEESSPEECSSDSSKFIHRLAYAIGG